MHDPFARLIPEARSFLSELAANNSRDWFNAHKADYETQLKSPAVLLLDQTAATIAAHGAPKPTVKLFRPQRDVRFSKDKTPYHQHLHMMWTFPGPAACGLFLGIAPDYCTVGGGIMGFGKDQMTAWRSSVDGGFGDELEALSGILALKGFAAKEPELKRVPAPFDKSHPHGTLLRRKSLTFWHELPEDGWPQPQAAVNSAWLTLAPAFKLLDEAFE